MAQPFPLWRIRHVRYVRPIVYHSNWRASLWSCFHCRRPLVQQGRSACDGVFVWVGGWVGKPFATSAINGRLALIHWHCTVAVFMSGFVIVSVIHIETIHFSSLYSPGLFLCLFQHCSLLGIPEGGTFDSNPNRMSDNRWKIVLINGYEGIIHRVFSNMSTFALHWNICEIRVYDCLTENWIGRGRPRERETWRDRCMTCF